MQLNAQENKKYLDEHCLMVYFEDSLTQLLSLRQENTKLKAMKFFREYFYNLLQGGHVIFRDFEFISASVYNKVCVAKVLMQVYQPLSSVGPMSTKTYHSLLQLLWPDFPYEVVHATVSSFLGSGDETSESGIPFLDFISAFQKCFCRGRFTCDAKKIQEQLLERIEHCKRAVVEGQGIAEWNEENSTCVSESDLKESMLEKRKLMQMASSWSLSNSSELKKAILLEESSSLDTTVGESPSFEKASAVRKLFQSTSGSKDSLELCSDQTKSPASGTRSRLCTRNLSGSLTLLQPNEKDKKEDTSHAPMHRLRSRSAVNIRRSSTLPHKREI